MNFRLIKHLCRLEVPALKRNLITFLKKHGYKPVHLEGFIYAEGTYPICLIAHMDTVFNFPPKEFFYDKDKKVLWSPSGSGFDDRAGIYGIIKILNDGFRPSVIFTDGEESGGLGATQLVNVYDKCPFNNCKALIELDRANKTDAVYYDCDNIEFEKYINQYGFHTEIGIFSDISIIAPIWGIAAVNLSIGYQDGHSRAERLHIDWCDDTIKKIELIVENSFTMKEYKYIPMVYKGTTAITCDVCGRVKDKNSVYKTIKVPNYIHPLLVCPKCQNFFC